MTGEENFYPILSRMRAGENANDLLIELINGLAFNVSGSDRAVVKEILYEYDKRNRGAV